MNLCSEFRLTLEKMGIENFPQSSFFNDFPRGCCGDTSNLLAKYLSEYNISPVYVWGINNNRQSHAWLEYQDWILDITAEQFASIDDKVLVTMDTTWHSQFIEQNREISNFGTYNNYNKNRLSMIYSNIKGNLLSGENCNQSPCK